MNPHNHLSNEDVSNDYEVARACNRDDLTYRFILTHVPSGIKATGRYISDDEDTEELQREILKEHMPFLRQVRQY